MKLIDKTIERNLESYWWRYHSTWMFTLIVTFLGEYATRQWGWPPQAIFMYVVLALSIIIGGGIRNSLAAATIITIYALYHREYYDTVRVVLLITGAYSIAIAGGYLKNRDRRLTRQVERLKVINEINQHKIKFVDDLNGNIEASNRINHELVQIITDERLLTKGDIIRRLIVVQDWAADLAQRTVGWHKLWEEKKEVIERGE